MSKVNKTPFLISLKGTTNYRFDPVNSLEAILRESDISSGLIDFRLSQTCFYKFLFEKHKKKLDWI